MKFSLFKNFSMRTKLILSFLLTSGIMILLFFCIILVFFNIVASVTDSYNTNSKLDEYTNLISQTQSALEEYMQVRTFESINNYYSACLKLKNKQFNFPTKPSNDEIALLEYKVNMLEKSFLQYAENAVVSRRANNQMNANTNYKIALKIYAMLSAEVSNLNSKYFHKNIARYNFTLAFFNKTASLGFFALLLVLFLSLIIVFILVTNIIKPLVEISKVAERISERHFDIPLLKIESNDEVGNICLAFNRMIVSIREYIDTIWENAVKESELKEKETRMAALYKDAQLKALQAQINPHFLFNTLNTGAGLATMEGADKTCYFIEQIADFFRYNIQQVDRDTTLSEELRIVDNYVYIMKVRFGNKFIFEKQIETKNLNARMPSMILQPLVENCIRHGLKEISTGGIITLRVSEHNLIENNFKTPPDFEILKNAESDKNFQLAENDAENCGKNGENCAGDKIQNFQNATNSQIENENNAGDCGDNIDFFQNIQKIQNAQNESFTQITICDNGFGISEEKRKQLLSHAKSTQNSDNAEVKEGHGIGLYNVIERLRLYYSSDIVFDIKQNPLGKGTCFIVRIPNVQHSFDR